MDVENSGGVSSEIKMPRMWIGYVIAVLFFITEIVEAMFPQSDTVVGVPPLLLISVSGSVYWLRCVYLLHVAMAEKSGNTHPVRPAESVGMHFIPLYNLYWIFHWPNQICEFVNARLPQRRMLKGWAGFFIFSGLIIGRVIDAAVGTAIIFLVGSYLTRAISAAIKLPAPELE